jgi:hypothetical protein
MGTVVGEAALLLLGCFAQTVGQSMRKLENGSMRLRPNGASNNEIFCRHVEIRKRRPPATLGSAR